MPAAKYRVVLHKAAVGEIKKLPAKIKDRVRSTIDQFSTEPVPRTALRLKGTRNAYRIRFGSYRLLYEIHATEIVVYVIGVAHRKEVYRRLLKRR